MSASTTLPRPRTEDELRDLGFGSVVSRESRQRLLNRDGSFNVTRQGLHFWSSLSPYQAMLTMSWTKFFTIVGTSYLLVNAAFACAYLLCGPEAIVDTANVHSQPGFLRAFFFSVQTFATIGYGHIAPSGLAANLVVTLESLVGLLGFALATGLLFSRFSRPSARILYSKSAVVAPYRGITGFEFRVINQRKSQLIELQAKVVLARFENINGGMQRRYYVLPLERNQVAFFPLSWTIVHPIDESSPLYQLTYQDLLHSSAEFLVLLTGIDETFSQTVHSRSSYTADEVVWDARFGNLFERSSDAQSLKVDIERFHAIERVRG
ncbi:MAG TPA: ion channel [Terriglobales bacterium]|nr:ion channel [Terriglobales bacterium]